MLPDVLAWSFPILFYFTIYSATESTPVLGLQFSTGLLTSFRYWIDTGFKSAIRYWVADIIPLLNRHRFQVCNSVLGCWHHSATESTPDSNLHSGTGLSTSFRYWGPYIGTISFRLYKQCRSSVGIQYWKSDIGTMSFRSSVSYNPTWEMQVSLTLIQFYKLYWTIFFRVNRFFIQRSFL